MDVVMDGQTDRRANRPRVAVAIVAGLIATWAPGEAGAQSEPGAMATASSASWAVGAAYEWHLDRVRYEFGNSSTFDTPFLVPHTFAQTYVADNQWLVLSARYRVGGERLESEFALTPRVTASASDVDTFLNPGGDVVTSGTSGDTRARAWRVAQWSHGRLWGIPLRIGYRYRRDLADFLPADIVVTHSQPPSVSRRFTTDREQTLSQVHEIPIDASRRAALSSAWRLVVGASVSPIIFARLTTHLPDKYPEPIVADARAFGIEARVELRRLGRRWPVAFGLGWGKSWSYKASQQFGRDALQISVRVGD